MAHKDKGYRRVWIGGIVAALGALLMFASACSEEWIDVRGRIEDGTAADFHLELPDHFDVGVPAQVTVWTYVGGCTREGPTRVSVDGSRVTIEPFDSIPAPGVSKNCPDGGRIYQHRVDVEVGQRGEVMVRVRGLRRWAGDTLITRDTTVMAQ